MLGLLLVIPSALWSYTFAAVHRSVHSKGHSFLAIRLDQGMSQNSLVLLETLAQSMLQAFLALLTVRTHQPFVLVRLLKGIRQMI